MADRSIDLATGLLGLGFQVALLIVLLRRGFFRPLPFFTFYVTYTAVITALDLWFMTHSARAFFSLYWITEGIWGILELLVLHEIFGPSLKMEYKFRPWLRLLPFTIFLSIIGWACWRAFRYPLGQGRYSRFAAGAYAFELGVHLLEIAILIISLRLAKRPYHPISNPYRLIVILGFGCMSCAVLVPDVIRLQARWADAVLRHWPRYSPTMAELDAVLRHLPPAAYLAVVVVWLIIFLRPEPHHRPATLEEIERLVSYQLMSSRQIHEATDLRPAFPS